jgi:hypothetical protein
MRLMHSGAALFGVFPSPTKGGREQTELCRPHLTTPYRNMV